MKRGTVAATRQRKEGEETQKGGGTSGGRGGPMRERLPPSGRDQGGMRWRATTQCAETITRRGVGNHRN